MLANKCNNLGATLVALAIVTSTPAGAASPVAAPEPSSEIRLSVEESALFDVLVAVTPYTVTVDAGLTDIDLILEDPSELVLSGGKARFRIRVRGATIPVDQVLEPELTVVYDAQRRQYLVVVSRLTVRIPLVGTIDLRDALPPLEIPALVEQVWALQSRSIGTRIHLRRVAIVEHRLELFADVDFPPLGGR